MKKPGIRSQTQIPRLILFLFLIIALFASDTYSQDTEWTLESSADGKTTVQSRVYYEEYNKGEEWKIIEYSATTTRVSLQNCVAVIQDASLHKLFFSNTEVSDKINDISENEFLIYYFYNAPWPLPNSDCVSRIRILPDILENKVTVSASAEPDLFEDKDVERAKLNNFTFIFQELRNEEVVITLYSKFSPVISAPNWMINAWFPKGPIEILERFIDLVETIE